MTAARKVIRALAVPIGLLFAVIVQLTIVNRAPLPGGAGLTMVSCTITAKRRPSGTTSALMTFLAAVIGWSPHRPRRAR